MEIVLHKPDIEYFISSYYKDIDEIVFEPKEIKVTLKISSIKPIHQIVNTPVSTPPKKVSPEKKLDIEKKKGLMASGGNIRILTKI